MAKLKVVALISGGKDSFFSMLHCLAQGHEIIALANLHPPLDESTVEDLDSFMYQTIGHNIIPLYEQALQLPLYRQTIIGDAVNSNKSYGPSSADAASDETESIIPLLQRVKAAHPEINAVSTGAILSDYQRTRIESVALRLGLTPLAYLWQYPRVVPHSTVALLEDMAAVGQDARIIKVASGGLDDSFIWTNVADQSTIDRLRKASRRFGDEGNGAALGEGGEYETLAIDGPASLWKSRINIAAKHLEIVPGQAGTASARILKANLVPKPSQEHEPVQPSIPALLEPAFVDLLNKLQQGTWAAELHVTDLEPTSGDQNTAPPLRAFLNEVMCFGDSAATQTAAVLDTISAELKAKDMTVDDIAYTSIILRDIADFAEVNQVYKQYFTKPNPPARMTLACAGLLPKDALLSITYSAYKLPDSTLRAGLHVQSLSYWAPANIGPYSQAVSIPARQEPDANLAFIAGQIPLVPASLELYVHPEQQSNFLHQTVLSLQHLHRIRVATGVKSWLRIAAFIVAADHDETLKRNGIATQVWNSAQAGFATSDISDKTDECAEDEDDENFDVWHQQQSWNQFGAQGRSRTAQLTAPSNGAIWSGSHVQLKVFKVDALPRKALIEWVAFGTNAEHDLSSIPVAHFGTIEHQFSSQSLS